MPKLRLLNDGCVSHRQYTALILIAVRRARRRRSLNQLLLSSQPLALHNASIAGNWLSVVCCSVEHLIYAAAFISSPLFVVWIPNPAYRAAEKFSFSPFRQFLTAK